MFACGCGIAKNFYDFLLFTNFQKNPRCWSTNLFKPRGARARAAQPYGAFAKTGICKVLYCQCVVPWREARKFSAPCTGGENGETKTIKHKVSEQKIILLDLLFWSSKKLHVSNITCWFPCRSAAKFLDNLNFSGWRNSTHFTSLQFFLNTESCGKQIAIAKTILTWTLSTTYKDFSCPHLDGGRASFLHIAQGERTEKAQR